MEFLKGRGSGRKSLEGEKVEKEIKIYGKNFVILLDNYQILKYTVGVI